MVKISEMVNKHMDHRIAKEFLGISVGLGMKRLKEVTPEHHSELYIMRKILARFYFKYPSKVTGQRDYEDGVDEEYKNKLMLRLYQDAINTYKQLADVLIGSKYFMLLNYEQRSITLDTIDYVTILEEEIIKRFEVNELFEDGKLYVGSDGEVELLVDGLLILFNEVEDEIETFQCIFERQNV